MGRFISIIGLILVCALLAFPQNDKKNDKKNANALLKPDFSGNWLLDRKQGNVGPFATPDLPLKITHHDPELIITRRSENAGQIRERDYIYYSDGRGESNPATMMLSTTAKADPQALDKQVQNSKTRWSGNKLVTTSLIRSAAAGHILQFEVIDEWKLSADGKTLTQTSRTRFLETSGTVFIPANVPETKRVYNRVPD